MKNLHLEPGPSVHSSARRCYEYIEDEDAAVVQEVFMKRSRLYMAMVLLIAVAVPGQVSSQSSKEEALEAAEKWLTLIDEGKYQESWEEAAPLFKSSVTSEQWEQTIRAVRKPIGRVLERNVRSSVYATSLPGAPDGSYYVIQFNSSFSSKKKTVETVTPMKGEDGVWRVSGYFIK